MWELGAGCSLNGGGDDRRIGGTFYWMLGLNVGL